MSGVGLDFVTLNSFPLSDLPLKAIPVVVSKLGPGDFFRLMGVSPKVRSMVVSLLPVYLRALAQILDCDPLDQAGTKRKFSQLLDVSKLGSKYFPITGSSSLSDIAKSSKEERDFLVFANAVMETQMLGKEFFSDAKVARDWINFLDETRVLQSITSLDLKEKGISFVPRQICRLVNLERLDLSHNQITFLTEEFEQLTQLKILKLQKNCLETLPQGMGKLENLRGLFLRGNRLRFLPETMGRLKNLQWILLGKNKLKALPQGLWTLKKLFLLDLSANQFSSFPPAMGDLENLTILDISGNSSVTLPTEVSRLDHLARMKLDHSQLAFLPVEIMNRENLVLELRA